MIKNIIITNKEEFVIDKSMEPNDRGKILYIENCSNGDKNIIFEIFWKIFSQTKSICENLMIYFILFFQYWIYLNR